MNISVTSSGLIKDFGMEEAYRLIGDAGFEAVDLGLDRLLSIRNGASKAPQLKDLCILERPLDEILEYFRPELEAMRKNNLRVCQIHAPFPYYVQGREDIVEYCIGLYRHCIEFADAIGCPFVVIHGHSPSPGKSGPKDDPAYIDALNWSMYRSLIDTLQKTNVTVCLENLYRGGPAACYYEGHSSDPHLAAAQIDTLNAEAGKECFGLCMDTGHLNMLGKRFYTYVPVLGNRIKCLHIHDNPGIADSHLAPYSGTTDWSEFTEELRKIGYRGNLSFETGSQVTLQRLPAPLVPVFLKLIRDVGAYFREEIQG